MGVSVKFYGLSWICRLFLVGRFLRRKEIGVFFIILNFKRNVVKKV